MRPEDDKMMRNWKRKETRRYEKSYKMRNWNETMRCKTPKRRAVTKQADKIKMWEKQQDKKIRDETWKRENETRDVKMRKQLWKRKESEKRNKMRWNKQWDETSEKRVEKGEMRWKQKGWENMNWDKTRKTRKKFRQDMWEKQRRDEMWKWEDNEFRKVKTETRKTR